MKRKNLMAVIALIAVFALALTACGGNAPAETTAAPTESTAPQPLALGWQMSASAWSSPNGATIHVAATPNRQGQSATFIVRLEGEEVANVPCEWDGTQYTASAELNAEDGLCYYVVMTDDDGTTTEFAVNTPTAVYDNAFINLASALTSYCNLLVDESSVDGNTLTISSGSVQVQAPTIEFDNTPVTCTKAALVLSCNGEDLDQEELTLTQTDTAGAYELALSGITLKVPEVGEEQQLSLRLDVELSDGSVLTAPGGVWYYSDGNLLPAVG